MGLNFSKSFNNEMCRFNECTAFYFGVCVVACVFVRLFAFADVAMSTYKFEPVAVIDRVNTHHLMYIINNFSNKSTESKMNVCDKNQFHFI